MQYVGSETVKESLSLISIKWFVTCFLDYLPLEPLLSLWDELLLSDRTKGPIGSRQVLKGQFRSLPLFHYAVGLVQLLEVDLLQMATMGETDKVIHSI